MGVSEWVPTQGVKDEAPLPYRRPDLIRAELDFEILSDPFPGRGVLAPCRHVFLPERGGLGWVWGGRGAAGERSSRIHGEIMQILNRPHFGCEWDSCFMQNASVPPV